MLAQLAAKIKDRRLLAIIRLWLDIAPVATPPASPATTPAKLTVVPETSAKSNKISQILEGGLDWGIQQLSSGGYDYTPSRYDLWDTDNPETDGEWPKSIAKNHEKQLRQQALRRLGIDGAMFGLSIARGLVRHGFVPGTLGTVLKAGATIGAAGTIGAITWRKWRKNSVLPTGELEVAITPAYVPPGERGIVQGAVLSPLFSNIYLHEFDCRLTEQGFKLVRFADDLVIVCRSERQANTALTTAEQILAEMGLNFKPAKTRICKLEKGFKFLGATLDANGKFELPMTGQNGKNWTSYAKLDWLKRTARTKPGVVQRGRKQF